MAVVRLQAEKRQCGLDRHVRGGHVDRLEHDLSHALTVDLGVQGVFRETNPELVVENVVRDFRHDIPFRDDIVRDEILQCQDTALVLRLGTNVTVFFVTANHGAWHVGGRGKRGTATAAIAANGSAMAADLWVSARWVTQRGNT